MSIGSFAVGSVEVSACISGESVVGADPHVEWEQRPLRIEINGADLIDAWAESTITVDDTLGEQVVATFALINPPQVPVPGDVVRMIYFDEVIFHGTVERIKRMVNNTQTVRLFECEAIDWSKILARNKVTRNFTDQKAITIIQSLLDNELAGEDMTLGRVDVDLNITLLDARGVSALDLLRDLAGVTGQSLIVQFDKSIHMQVSTNDLAPRLLTIDTLEAAELTVERDNYRNVQTVHVTGTPASVSSEDPNIVIVDRLNQTQIDERSEIEGGTGRYEAYEEIKHPLSNRTDDLELLARTYGDTLLNVYGTFRQVLTCRVRGYGFRAGQFASLDVERLGVSGDWLIQRVSIVSDSAAIKGTSRSLVYSLELVLSNVQQRAYESWIKIIKQGKITVQIYSAIPHSSTIIGIVGSGTFVVPAGVTTLLITAGGAPGGGAGGINWAPAASQNGGRGGNGGKATSSVAVEEGQTIDVFIGTKGSGGAAAVRSASSNGTDGTDTYCNRGDVELVRAEGGKGGRAPTPVIAGGPAGADGAPGGGSGGIVSVGGGPSGGAGGQGNITQAGQTPSNNGYVNIEY